MSKKILVAVAWPYVNGDIHVGHLAGYLLPADMFARYQRLKGNDVMMVSGSDCHGTPITVEADKRGVHPSEIVGKYHKNDIELFRQYELSYNLYTKTTTENHKRVVQELFLDLLKNDYIVKDVMKQYYSDQDSAFLPDRYVEGTCPHCGAGQQRSDQCENCGRWLGDGELINPVSKITGAAVSLKDTEHYFLDFAKAQEKLEEYVKSKQLVWRNWVYQETVGWLKEGLQKRAITRDMDWAIDLPVEEIMKLSEDKQLADFTGKKLYVWFEAVIGYLSAPQEWSSITSESDEMIYNKFPGQSDDWKDWWMQGHDAEHYYFMGQDNLVFHTLMWPAELIGTGKDYVLPHNVSVCKFMNLEGKKISKSRGWTIDSKQLADKFGVDAVRYYIASNVPENKESNFSWDGFASSINNELVADIGNFIHRTLSFLSSKLEGDLGDSSLLPEVKDAIDQAFAGVRDDLDATRFTNAIEKIMALAKFGNKFFDESKPWVSIKENPASAQQSIYNCVQIVSALSTLLAPIIPGKCEELCKMLGIEPLTVEVGIDRYTFREVNKIVQSEKPQPIFAKIESEMFEDFITK